MINQRSGENAAGPAPADDHDIFSCATKVVSLLSVVRNGRPQACPYSAIRRMEIDAGLLVFRRANECPATAFWKPAPDPGVPYLDTLVDSPRRDSEPGAQSAWGTISENGEAGIIRLTLRSIGVIWGDRDGGWCVAAGQVGRSAGGVGGHGDRLLTTLSQVLPAALPERQRPPVGGAIAVDLAELKRLSAAGLLQIAISVILSVASGCCLIVP